MQTLLDKAREAIHELSSDVSISAEAALEGLKTLERELDVMIEGLEWDIERALEIDCGEAGL